MRKLCLSYLLSRTLKSPKGTLPTTPSKKLSGTEYLELKTVLTPEEYTAARESTLTAFYTPQAITDTIVDVLHDKKVRPKLVLEPSAGMGAFIAPAITRRASEQMRSERMGLRL